LNLCCIWPDGNGVKKKALSAKRGQLFEHSELLPGAVDKAFLANLWQALIFCNFCFKAKVTKI